MARSASPWYREDRQCWSVIIDGKRYSLGEHPDLQPPRKNKKNKWVVPKAILDRFDDLKVALRQGQPSPLTAAKPPVSVAEVFEKFLEWCQVNRSARTYEWSKDHIQCFCDHLKAREVPIRPARFPALELAPIHLSEWIDFYRRPREGKRLWGANHSRGAMTAVVRAFSWAAKQRLISENPIRGIEKPTAVRREQVLTQDEFGKLLAEVKDRPFRDVLEFCWETGCRVQEVRLLERAHYKSELGRFELPPAQAKGRKRWRLIYLTKRAEEIVKPLVLMYPSGSLFRNVDGGQWDAQNFNGRFCRLKVKLGTKYALTAIRHSFATRLLEAGVDNLTVSALLGHADGSMVLSRTYSHIGEKSDFLREELLRVSGAKTSAA